MRRFAPVLLLLLAAAGAPAAADITVAGPFFDDATQGDWRDSYGNCFYLLPDGWQQRTRSAVGPDGYAKNHDQYRYNNCYGGPIFSRDSGETAMDFRIFRNHATNPEVTAWHTTAYVEESAQWNPCLETFKHATWSNGMSNKDPLTVELRMNAHGTLQIAYYFTNALNVCRETEFAFLVDGVEMASGTIADIENGKYVIFEIEALKASPLGNVFSLKAWDAPGDAVCENMNEETLQGVNTHISGVFVDVSSGGNSCSKNVGNTLIFDE
jgi:hypothetical protein